MKEKTLVQKICWAENIHKKGEEEILKHGRATICLSMYLENEGFGMLADKNNLNKLDRSYSVVCPDETIIPSNYLMTNYKTDTKLEDLSKIQKANLYYGSFIFNIDSILSSLNLNSS